LFSNIEVNPRPDETKEGGIVVEIKLKELEPKSAEVSTEWSIVPGREGRPTLVMYLFIWNHLFLLEPLYIRKCVSRILPHLGLYSCASD
jgi:hypothetical protein